MSEITNTLFSFSGAAIYVFVIILSFMVVKWIFKRIKQVFS